MASRPSQVTAARKKRVAKGVETKGASLLGKQAKAKRKPPGGIRQAINPYERVQLMSRLAAYRADAKPWTEIAKLEGKPIRTLQAVLSQYERTTKGHDDPLGIVNETLLLYAEGISIFAEVAATAEMDTARIGAARSMLDAAKGRLELLSAIGKMPRMLSAYRDAADLDRVFRDMGQVLEQHDAPPELMRALLAVMSGETPKGTLALAGGDMIEGDYDDDDPEF